MMAWAKQEVWQGQWAYRRFPAGARFGLNAMGGGDGGRLILGRVRGKDQREGQMGKSGSVYPDYTMGT